MISKTHKTTNQPSGMTLVEIMFALAIIGMILTLSYAAALRAWRSAQVANQRTQAQYVAQDAIEKVKAYRDLNATTGTQKTMPWSGAPRQTGAGIGSGAFLQEIQSRAADGFTVQSCTLAEVANGDCYWKVVTGGQAVTAISDSTAYTVTIRSGKVYCKATEGTNINTGCSGSPDISDIQSVTLEATVTYTDANGVAGSNASATTILNQP